MSSDTKGVPSVDSLDKVRRYVCVPLHRRALALSADVDSDELLSRAWEILARHSKRVAAADDPWGYLYRCVERWMMTQITASALAMRPTRGRALWDSAREHETPARLGEDVHWVVDAASSLTAEVATFTADDSISGEIAGVRRALVTIVKSVAPTSLVGDHVQGQFRDAVWYIADWAGRYHLATITRSLVRDPYLLDVCGRTSDQVLALANLVLGPRRAGPKASAVAELIAEPGLPWPKWQTSLAVRRIRQSFSHTAQLQLPVVITREHLPQPTCKRHNETQSESNHAQLSLFTFSVRAGRAA